MKRIVLVDDSRTSRMFIRRCFEISCLQEIDFHEAADGAEALVLLQRVSDVDLLVTDLNMPNMDGEMLLKRVQEDQTLSAVPVVVITSAGNPAKEAELLAQGAFAVLNKPVSPATLNDKLGAIIQSP
jgi:two-component system chemotaxis response regulator CheY